MIQYKKVDYSKYWRPTLILQQDVSGSYYGIYDHSQFVGMGISIVEAIKLAVKIERDMYKRWGRIS